MKNITTTDTPPLTGLLDALRGLIKDGRHRALRAVDMVQVRTCREIGRHIVEFEQGGEARAAYGKGDGHVCAHVRRPEGWRG